MKLRFREFRDRAGLSQQQAANDLGISKLQLWRLEKGVADGGQDFKGRHLEQFAELYQCEPEDLISDRDPDYLVNPELLTEILGQVLEKVDSKIFGESPDALGRLVMHLYLRIEKMPACESINALPTILDDVLALYKHS